jgi:hypothetical protein
MPEPCSICLCSRALCSCSSRRRSNSSCCLDSEGVGGADEHPIKLTKISQAIRLIRPTLFVTSGLISFGSSKTAHVLFAHNGLLELECTTTLGWRSSAALETTFARLHQPCGQPAERVQAKIETVVSPQCLLRFALYPLLIATSGRMHQSDR